MQATKQKMSPSWCVMLTLKRSDCKSFFKVQKFRQEISDLRVDFRYAKEQKQRKVRKYAQINFTDTQSSILLPL